MFFQVTSFTYKKKMLQAKQYLTKLDHDTEKSLNWFEVH